MTRNKLFSEGLSSTYHTLRAPRRCYAIERLWDDDCEQLTVRTLAREIAAREEDVSPECATGDKYRNAYNALSQTHLPTLDDAEIIIYDSNRQTVVPGPNFTLAVLVIAINRTVFRTLVHGDVLQSSTSD